jgi:hypothetical protein
VPGGFIFAWDSPFTTFDPQAALIRSEGNPFMKIYPKFDVPASSLDSAEMSWAFSQPVSFMFSEEQKNEKKKKKKKRSDKCVGGWGISGYFFSREMKELTARFA